MKTPDANAALDRVLLYGVPLSASGGGATRRARRRPRNLSRATRGRPGASCGPEKISESAPAIPPVCIL
jgi:hypothetical protein